MAEKIYGCLDNGPQYVNIKQFIVSIIHVGLFLCGIVIVASVMSVVINLKNKSVNNIRYLHGSILFFYYLRWSYKCGLTTHSIVNQPISIKIKNNFTKIRFYAQ